MADMYTDDVIAIVRRFVTDTPFYIHPTPWKREHMQDEHEFKPFNKQEFYKIKAQQYTD